MTGVTTFSEVMTGPLRLVGEKESRDLQLRLDVTAPGRLRLWKDTLCTMTGRAVCPGWADSSVEGTMRIAPLTARQIRYTCDFTVADGRRLHLDGWKSISFRHVQRSMTTLPVTVLDDEGELVGDGVLLFDSRRDLLPFLRGFRYHRGAVPQERIAEAVGRDE